METLGKTLVVLLVVGLIAVALGPTWTVREVRPAVKNMQAVVCSEKFHSDRTRTVTVPATTKVDVGRTCPG